MLADAALQNLRPGTRIYKVTDRDGMYVVVAISGTITFRYDYRMHGRRETLTIGRYGRTGISLARVWELPADERALRAVGKGLA